MNHAAIIEEDTMEKPKSANGVSGMLLKTMDGKFIFRVYNFYDYMDSVLDHSPATLGIKD